MPKKIVSPLLITLLIFSCAVFAEEAPAVITVGEWLDSKGENTGLVITQVQEVINPVLAVIADETGSVNLYGVVVDGEFTDFFTAGIAAGDIILIRAPRYNEFEGAIEMADSVLLRHASIAASQ